MSPLSPCFIIIVIITALTLCCRLWCRQNTRYGWWRFGLGDQRAIWTHYRERERASCGTPSYRLASSLGCWLIYNCCLISQKERAAQAASVQPSSYLHYCPLSFQLSLTITLFLSFSLIFVSLNISLSLSSFVLLHYPSLCIRLSIACFNSLTSRAIIPLLLFLLQRKKKGESQRGLEREPFI